MKSAGSNCMDDDFVKRGRRLARGIGERQGRKVARGGNKIGGPPIME